MKGECSPDYYKEGPKGGTPSAKTIIKKEPGNWAKEAQNTTDPKGKINSEAMGQRRPRETKRTRVQGNPSKPRRPGDLSVQITLDPNATEKNGKPKERSRKTMKISTKKKDVPPDLDEKEEREDDND